MASYNLTNIMPDGIKPSPEPMLTDHQWGLRAFTWGQFHKKCSRYIYLSVTRVWKILTITSPRYQWVNFLASQNVWQLPVPWLDLKCPMHWCLIIHQDHLDLPRLVFLVVYLPRAHFTKTWFNPVKCGMKLLIHSQMSTVPLLKFGIG